MDGQPSDKQLSFGEKAVGITFNPSGDYLVNAIKGMYASVIDELYNLRMKTYVGTEYSGPVSTEKTVLFDKAILEAQTAQMWAVKAITWKY